MEEAKRTEQFCTKNCQVGWMWLLEILGTLRGAGFRPRAVGTVRVLGMLNSYPEPFEREHILQQESGHRVAQRVRILHVLGLRPQKHNTI